MAYSIVGTAEGSIAEGAVTTAITLPGGTAEGDLVLVLCGGDTNPDGFTATGNNSGAYTSHFEVTSSAPTSSLFSQVMGSTPDTSITVSEIIDRSTVDRALVVVLRGVDGTLSAIQSASASSGMPNPPSHTTGGADKLRVICGFLDDENVASSITAPSGFENVQAIDETNRITIMAAFKAEATAGALDPDAFGGSGTDAWVALHFDIGITTSGSSAEATPGAGSVTALGQAPTLPSGIGGAPGAGTVAVAGLAPSVSAASTASPGVGAATVAGRTPTAGNALATDVLINVAGQSNSRIAGLSSGTPPAYLTDGSLGDVKIFVKGSGDDISTGTFENYVVAADGTSTSDPDNTGWAWGAEAEFIYQMRQAGDTRPVKVVKESVNGQDIADQWAPGSSGKRFDQLEDKMDRARALIPLGFIEEITLWNQGEADANDETKATNYNTNFTTFLTAYRSRISTGLFIAQRIRPLGYEGASETENSAGFGRAQKVREATIAVCVADGNAAVVDTDFDVTNFNSIHPVEVSWATGIGQRSYAVYDDTHDATYGAITDAVPDAFSVPDVSGVAPSATVYSRPIDIEGIERQAAVTITNGEFQVLNSLDLDYELATWASSGFVDKFQRIRVRTTADASTNTAKDVTVEIGGVSDTWTVTTYASAPTREAETTAFAAAVEASKGGTISGSEADQFDTFFTTAKASTWWAKLLRVFLRLGDRYASAQDLVNADHELDHQYGQLTDIWDWDPVSGWTGKSDSTGGLRLGVNPSSEMGQNASAYGVKVAAVGSNSSYMINSDDNNTRLRTINTGAARYNLFSGSNENVSGLDVDPGWRSVVRSASNVISLHGTDGVALDTGNAVSEPDAVTYMEIGNSSGIYSDASIFAVFVASDALSVTELANMHAAFDTLQANYDTGGSAEAQPGLGTVGVLGAAPSTRAAAESQPGTGTIGSVGHAPFVLTNSDITIQSMDEGLWRGQGTVSGTWRAQGSIAATWKDKA